MFEHEILANDEMMQSSYERMCGSYEEGEPLHALSAEPIILEFFLVQLESAEMV